MGQEVHDQLRKQALTKNSAPYGFGKFFGKESLAFTQVTNLLPELTKIGSQEALGLVGNLDLLDHYELENEGTNRRDLVLMKDKEGNTSMVVVCRDTYQPPEKDLAYGQLMVIGGIGIYETPPEEIAITHALKHTKRLAKIMTRKCFMAGLDVTGMKATIPQESDWERSKMLRLATGFLFSPQGPFKDAITGTDSRQTPDTIADMAEGSKIGGGQDQIAGTIEALDTPGSCRFSLEQTYAALLERKEYCDLIPNIKDSTVIVEGFGRIGRTAVRLALEKGATVIISDPLLTGEDELLPKSLREKPEELAREKDFYAKKINDLKQNYGDRIRVAQTEELFEQQAQIYYPCSNVEGSLNKERLRKLAEHGIKLILSGANNPFGSENIWKLARLAHELGIIFPPEILTNCGSVSAASAETLFRAAQSKDNFLTPEKFVKEKVRPFIADNTRSKLAQLLAIVNKLNVDLYTAGEILFRTTFELLITLNENKELVD